MAEGGEVTVFLLMPSKPRSWLDYDHLWEWIPLMYLTLCFRPVCIYSVRRVLFFPGLGIGSGGIYIIGKVF